MADTVFYAYLAHSSYECLNKKSTIQLENKQVLWVMCYLLISAFHMW